MTERYLERAIEWESAAQPSVLERVRLPTPPFVPGATKLTISRDDNLQLRLVAEGVLTAAGEVARRRERVESIPLGAFVPATKVSFDVYGSRLHLEMHLEPTPSPLEWIGRERRFQQRGAPYLIRQTWTQQLAFPDGDNEHHRMESLGKPAWQSDWYVNGETVIYFTGHTKRQRPASFKREREFQSVAVYEGPGGGDSRDHLVVDAGSVRFAFCEVAEAHAPEGLGAVSIDFVPPIPTADTRTAIGEIVSFVLGRRMMLLGSTTFDSSGHTIEVESVNPWGTNVRALCLKPGLPPVPYDHDGGVLEALLVDLIPRYLAAREPLGLKDALWSYWIAKESPASIDLPIFASAVEALKKGWLSSTGSKSKGVHMSKADFEGVAGDLVEEVRKRVRDRGASEEIVRNFAGANRMGLGEQMRAFLDEIGLSVGECEKAAMGARHRSAHGAGADEELTELIRHGTAYQTLFERVFLRVLGYEGPYVDRTTEGYPVRPLNDPTGGS
jgi:hypothetical protein